MITDCDLWVIGQGYEHISDVSPGDRVYSLNGLKVEESPVLSCQSNFVNQKIEIINSGQHNLECTKDTLHLYYSDNRGLKYLLTKDFDSHTRSKSTDPSKYNPVLAWPHTQGHRNCTDVDLEYIARMVVSKEYDIASFISIVDRCTGEDALVLVDMLEFWCSEAPGKGRFDRMSVGSRAHFIHDRVFVDHLSRITAFAGFTSSIVKGYRGWWIKIFYESMPVPGSIPKNQKLSQKLYTGMVYSIEVEGKRPVFGRHRNRCVYLPVY